MKKFLLFAIAGMLLSSCDNLKKKSNTDDDQVEVKKKKPLSDDETTDEETPVKKRKPATDDEETDVVPTTRNNRNTDNTDETTEKNTTSDNAGGWTSKEEDTFIQQCVNTASAKVGNSKAKTYCSCMLEKIEAKYDNAAEFGKSYTQKQIDNWAADCNQQ